MDHLQTDVLVVGGGGAAARAAIEAFDAGARVTLVTKGKLGTGGATGYAIADFAGLAVADGIEDPTDSPELHWSWRTPWWGVGGDRDRVKGGLALADDGTPVWIHASLHQHHGQPEEQVLLGRQDV